MKNEKRNTPCESNLHYENEKKKKSELKHFLVSQKLYILNIRKVSAIVSLTDKSINQKEPIAKSHHN